MLQPWVGLISAAAAVAVVVAVIVWSRPGRERHSGDGEVPIANIHHAEASLVFRRLRRRYQSLLGAEVIALSVVGLSAVGLTMRPLGERIDERDVRNRDVMLCLDVSGSMINLDAAVITAFADLAAGLDGERIGLTMWNGSAVSVFPLTDDSDYIAETLEKAAVDIIENKQLFLAGTNEGGSSLIGDGLASCAIRFDRLDESRARSIILATDNMRAGTPIVSLEQAGEFAVERGIRVYAIVADHTPYYAADTLEEVVTGTGGASFQMADDHAVASVIEEIGRLEASRIDLPGEVVTDDRPTAWILSCLAGIGALVAAGWALRR